MIDFTVMTENVTKLEAAKRQLRTTIKLFLAEEDALSTHTLAAATRGILSDLMKARGADSPFYMMIRPDRLKEVRDKVNESQNFLKHADRDPAAVRVFRPALSEFLIFDCTQMYYILTGRSLYASAAFQTWFCMKHADLFVKKPIIGPALEKLMDSMKDVSDSERRRTLLALVQNPEQVPPGVDV